MKQAYGNWVSGDRFWNRKQDLELLIERIEDGQHILLVAQRRMGKTSLMREVIGLIENRYICLFVDFQKSWKTLLKIYISEQQKIDLKKISEIL